MAIITDDTDPFDAPSGDAVELGFCTGDETKVCDYRLCLDTVSSIFAAVVASVHPSRDHRPHHSCSGCRRLLEQKTDNTELLTRVSKLATCRSASSLYFPRRSRNTPPIRPVQHLRTPFRINAAMVQTRTRAFSWSWYLRSPAAWSTP